MFNYKHLRYFWMVAKHGSIAKASEVYHVTPQTISGQITLLEEYLEQALFEKSGRNLVMTDTGRMVFSYADEIFSLGNELEESVRNRSSSRPLVFKVGIADVVPKSIAYRIIEPALNLNDPIRLLCRENSFDNLLAQLALHQIDVILADKPIPNDVDVRGFNHLLGESSVSFLAAPKLASQLRKSFPNSLHNAPFLMPSDNNILQSQLFNWFNRKQIHPAIVGEFDDSALVKVFGQKGKGVFVVPTAIANEVTKQFTVSIVGQTDDVTEKFYAISVERRISHPAVSIITKTARSWLL